MTDAVTVGAAQTPAWRARINMIVGWPLFHALYRVHVVGRHRVPRTGPVVFVANHVGFLDGPMLPGLAPRPTSVLVKREMFKGLLGWFLTWIGHIPVTRNSGDRQALTAAVAVLHAGGAVGIFPEGTRGRGDVAAVQQGAAWLAQQGGAQVVPVAFLGTRATGAAKGSLPRLRTRMVVEFGNPVDLATDPAVTAATHGRQRLAAATDVVRLTLSNHVRESQERHRVFLPEDDGWQGRDPQA
ncbi:1-acyl-sn-glycerol-3-phosphate acyltransferase [Pedococcus dokdonensis]|uniref:1-acyl-sn-glycerol-3-phosphate acyltransferase n=1 Tax=Pedococcus dokdonensis TaxID=443156 RepID=A0A1H0NKB4_9MICO|nr:lysophospholipid acyltransferase family protein [Pedococcus dokdonensis]SDO93081.1 1-acyl-sn-glycerol-3-phosphate acyltransferase [Pedococcus dokdonensis]